MADKTGIEWTDATWNPVRGCSRVSEGCRNCYAESIAARFSKPGLPYAGFADATRAGSKWTGRVDVIWPLIDLPLRWRGSRRIFVNSMSDLFHESIDNEELASIYANMIAAHHVRGHTFQVLSKRAAQMRWLLNHDAFWYQVNAEAGAQVMANTDPLDRRRGDARATLRDYGPDAPPPGIWLGASVEHQDAAEERIPDLCGTPAAVRFLSCEPLLGNIDFLNILRRRNAFAAMSRIDWVIAGGESGPNARPMHPDWARGLRDQCATAGVPFFFKQWGEWHPDALLCTDVHDVCPPQKMKIGKKRAGAVLDGKLYREFPKEHP